MTADLPIYMLWWCNNFMGWSHEKEDLHKWAKDLDATFEDEEEQGTTYAIITCYSGFDLDSEVTETFEIMIKK